MSETAYAQLTETLGSAGSLQTIHAACSKICTTYGFDYFFYGVKIPVSLANPQLIIISGYPTEWVQHYKEQNYIAIDPVIAYCATHSPPLDWQTLAAQEKSNRHIRLFMGEARNFGLQSGLTCPVNSPSGQNGMLCLASDQSVERTAGRVREYTPALFALSTHLHEAVRRTIEVREMATSRKALTPRERECLLWAAEGKTSWETSGILGIADRTVVFHLQNAMAKLGVSSKQHAVARALSLGLIAPVLEQVEYRQ